MAVGTKLSSTQAEKNMSGYKPPYSRQEAVIEANRCLFCFDAPCIMACPTGIDIPSFIKKIASGNPTASARTILRSNPLGASCAQVCPTNVLCEGACVVLAREGDPVKIGRLQRYATDHVYSKAIEVLSSPVKKSGRRIAIIGGGPAGLGCAAELAQLGHQAVIFEKEELAGGLNTYGIAIYKMHPSVSLREIEMIKGLGVEIRCGVQVGRDISAEQLKEEFDAIFIGVGLGKSHHLNVPGEDLPEVVDALDFIAQVHSDVLHEVPVGDNVAVIGCGNTAIDALTQSKRLGANNATIIYRRGEQDMPAYGFEYELAKSDGGKFYFHTVVKEIVADNGGHVSSLVLQKSQPGPNGRPEAIPGSEFSFACDMVLKAVGSMKQTEMIRSFFPDLEFNPNGTVKLDIATRQTTVPEIFCGGDCANGGREVVNAVAEGIKGARGIHAYLSGELVESPLQPSRFGVNDRPSGSGFTNPIRVTEL